MFILQLFSVYYPADCRRGKGKAFAPTMWSIYLKIAVTYDGGILIRHVVGIVCDRDLCSESCLLLKAILWER